MGNDWNSTLTDPHLPDDAARRNRPRLRGHRLRRYGITLAIIGAAMWCVTFATQPQARSNDAGGAGFAGQATQPQAAAIVIEGAVVVSDSLDDPQRFRLESFNHLLRGAAVALIGLGLLAHSIGIYRADRALGRRQRQQCEACGYDLRGCMGAPTCPECGDHVRCLPSIRVR
ncbi:MAG: hypothetical protein WD768_08380 [Phycisphaeraceae bacterium]